MSDLDPAPDPAEDREPTIELFDEWQVIDADTGAALSVPMRAPFPPNRWADQFRVGWTEARLRNVSLQHRTVSITAWHDHHS